MVAMRACMCHAGVQGIGLDDSAVGLYEGEDGERGLMALRVRTENEYQCTQHTPSQV